MDQMVGKAQQIANDRYKELAARCGDICFRKQVLEKEQTEILEEMRMINAAVPGMLHVEGEVIKAVQEGMAQSEKANKETVAKVVEVMKNEQPKHPPRNS